MCRYGRVGFPQVTTWVKVPMDKFPAWSYCRRMDGALSNWKVIALLFVAMLLGGVATAEFLGVFDPVLDDPVGTLRLDELSVALATDPDREVERIVGHAWRFEGPKSTLRAGGRYHFFAVDLGTHDGVETWLHLRFATGRDEESRFETEEVAIACLITASGVFHVEPTSSDNDQRTIAATDCRVVEPDTNPASDSP
jgi:hypothetical protein